MDCAACPRTRGDHPVARRPQDAILLVLAEFRPIGPKRARLRDAPGSRLRRVVADADRQAAAAPIARLIVQPAGDRRTAIHAAALANAIIAQNVAIALDHALAAAGAIRGLPAGIIRLPV